MGDKARSQVILLSITLLDQIKREFGHLKDESALFALGFFIYWLFINNSESYLSFNSGVFTFGLVVGGLLTRALNGSASGGLSASRHDNRLIS